MAHVRAGWMRMKTVGEVEVLVDKYEGKFGTQLASNNSSGIQLHDTLQEAMETVRSINESKAIDALMVIHQRDLTISQVPEFQKVRIRRQGRIWTFTDGDRPFMQEYFCAHDADVFAEIEKKRAAHSELLQQAEQLRQEIWGLVQHLGDPQD